MKSAVDTQFSDHLYYYSAYGLSFASELELPPLQQLSPRPSPFIPDVEIVRGPVPRSLENPLKNGVRFQIKPGHLLMQMDGVARFYVTGGHRIVVESEPGSSEADMRVFLLGSVMVALFHQRKLLPLHASAIRVRDHCVIFCGPSGSGKSTAAHAFVRRGYAMLTDDICVTDPGQNREPMAFPGYPGFKLWEDSLLKYGDDPGVYTRIRQQLKKYMVPVPGQFNPEPLPIAKIYILSPSNSHDIRLQPVTGLNTFSALRRQTCKFKFIKFMGTADSYLQRAAQLSSRVPVIEVFRPIRPFLPNRLADILAEDFER